MDGRVRGDSMRHRRVQSALKSATSHKNSIVDGSRSVAHVPIAHGLARARRTPPKATASTSAPETRVSQVQSHRHRSSGVSPCAAQDGDR
jgi:hypothetical protein